MARITDKHSRIISDIARFRTLTVSQFGRLGTDDTSSNLNPVLNDLIGNEYKLLKVFKPEKDRNKVKQQSISKSYGLVDKEYVYYLSPEGIKVVQGELQDDATLDINWIKYPKGELSRGNYSYWHNKLHLDTVIELYLSCKENGMSLLHYDFDLEKEKISAIPKPVGISHVVLKDGNIVEPDGVFRIDTGKGSTGVKMFVVEFERRELKNYLDVWKKLEFHIDQVLRDGLINKKYNHPRRHKLLMIFEHEKTMFKAIEYVTNYAPSAADRVLFKTYFDIVPKALKSKNRILFEKSKNYCENWLTISGDRVNMLS